MGCISSSSDKHLSPQAMQDKQREIMLARQREFEKKRQEKNPTGMSSQQNITPSKPRVKSAASPTPEFPALESPAPPEVAIKKPSAESPAPTITVVAVATATTTTTTTTNEPSLTVDPSVVQMRTLDVNDLNARRSKNVHDLAMYGKDVTRRASFNPRPKESPFTPELQQQMRKGHELMMEEEAKKKQQRLETASISDTKEEAKEEEEGFSFGKGEEEPAPVKKSLLEVAVEAGGDVVSAAGEAPSSPLPDAKFTVRNPQDRLSKNAHDMSQYMGGAKNFNRRLSVQPPQ